jgi:ATP-binding cassette subfamily F protein 3
MINITDLCKSFGGKILFDNLNLGILPKEKLGLVGRNGHGKTTLFKMITGQMQYDSGSIIKPKNYRIGYLSQHIHFSQGSVIKETSLALNQNEADETWKAEKILFGLGFSKSDMLRNPLEFSGGYKIRINLAKLLLSDADMLLLDEPNNYLDIVAIRWLSKFLREWKGELILITHDRSFMDAAITHCAAIHRNKIRKVSGGTQKLYQQIEKEEEIYEKTRLNFEKKKKQTEIFIRRFRAKARLAGMVQSRIKSLEKQETLKELSEIKNLDFAFCGKNFPAAKMLAVHNLSFGYEKEKTLFENLSFDVLKKERICIIGKNGKGKSTLLKLLAGRLNPVSGSIKSHPDLTSSYFVQSDAAELNDQKTVFDEIISSDSSCLPQQARNIAGAMMFSGDDALKKISVLSGGEKSRVMLGKILAKPCHLLLLDEPTNHLDIESCESLIDAIDEFDGSVILVTHNEEILRAIAQKLIIFDSNKVSVFEGSYDNFLALQGWQDEGEIKSVKVSAKTKNEKPLSNGKAPSNVKVFLPEEKKKLRAVIIQEKSKVLRTLEKEIADIEDKIYKAEKELAENNEKLLNAAIDKNIEVLSKTPKINKELRAQIEALYENLSIKADELDEKKEYFAAKIMEY